MRCVINVRKFRNVKKFDDKLFENSGQPIRIANEMNFEMITNPRQPTPISLIFFCFVFNSYKSIATVCAGINTSF